MPWLLLALAIAPGAFWMWYFRQRDHLRPEPRHLVGRVFAYGCVAALAAAVLLAGASHAAYDAAIFTGTWVALTVLPFIFLLWRASLHYVRRAHALDTARRMPPAG